MSDVSAVVLTLGEATTDEALAGLRRQTLPPHETIVIRGMSPFHQAINAGARQVTTPFFVQVDADMILDPGCLAALRGRVARNSGIVVGHLRDALIGTVVGVKLFRTRPYREVLMGDTISPDTDLGRALQRSGWRTVYVGRPPRNDPEAWPTLGEHRPDYRPEYTYRKYLLEGRRYRYRNNPNGIRWHFGRLEASRHGSATVAQVALANGIFLDSTRDLLGPLEPDAGFARMSGFLAEPDRTRLEGGDRLDPPPPRASLGESFELGYALGRELYRTGRSSSFRERVDAWHGSRTNDAVLVAKIGLCRGALAPDADTGAMAADVGVLGEFLAARPEPAGTVALRGLASRLGRWLWPGT